VSLKKSKSLPQKQRSRTRPTAKTQMTETLDEPGSCVDGKVGCYLAVVVSGDAHGRAVYHSMHGPKALIYTEKESIFRFRIDRSGWTFDIQNDGTTIDVAHATLCYWRRPLLPRRKSDTLNAAFAAREILEVYAAVAGLCKYHRRGRLVTQGTIPPLSHNKILQLIMAKESGLQIPATIVTNEPNVALSFYTEHNSNIVFKCLGIPVVEDTTNTKCGMIYTSRVPGSDFSTVNAAPCLFQEALDKQYELRIAVVGDRIIPVRIDSQATMDGRIDWRREMDNSAMYEQLDDERDLPRDVRIALCKLHERLGLHWGMVDMVVTPDNRYVFLETNPDGAWLWLEEELGDIGITKCISEALSALALA
jgi:hypothetical protein